MLPNTKEMCLMKYKKAMNRLKVVIYGNVHKHAVSARIFQLIEKPTEGKKKKILDLKSV